VVAAAAPAAGGASPGRSARCPLGHTKGTGWLGWMVHSRRPRSSGGAEGGSDARSSPSMGRSVRGGSVPLPVRVNT
jgi:hypothetical protein